MQLLYRVGSASARTELALNSLRVQPGLNLEWTPYEQPLLVCLPDEEN